MQDRPRIVIYGDSHANAIKRAISRRHDKQQSMDVEVSSVLKLKNGKPFGDVSIEDFLDSIRRLAPHDIVVSAIGGNQHAVFSTIQHPKPFDFHLGPDALDDLPDGTQIIPTRALRAYFESGLRSRDGTTLQALRKATSARLIHLIPPPPKEDSKHIEDYHETHFAKEGISALGVSSSSLRLKFWRLQTALLHEMCGEWNIEVIDPPAEALTDQGFLAPPYYARDATHANVDYGELLLRRIDTAAGIAEQP